MFKDSYRSLQERIEPDRELLEKTKRKMYTEQLAHTKRAKTNSYRHILAAVAIVTILIGAASQFQVVRHLLLSRQNIYRDNMTAIEKSEDIVMIPDEVSSADTDQKAENEIEPVFLSEADSYAHVIYGKFLPQILPDTYQFEEAVIYNENTAEEKLLFLYTEDFNEFRVSITRKDMITDYQERTVKAFETDSYNITSYSIPYADTIPESLYLTMRHPIFQWSELTPEVLAMRKENRSEQGESSQTSIVYRFAVEWQDYIIDYYVKSANISENEIFSMISSAKTFIE